MNISPIELKTNINTDAVNEDIVYMNSQGECIQNTGIVLPGEAVTNQYLEETTYSDANLEEVYINSKGQVYKSYTDPNQSQQAYMTIDGQFTGRFWKAGVDFNGEISGYSDYILSSTGTVLACRYDSINSTTSATVGIYELSYSNGNIIILNHKQFNYTIPSFTIYVTFPTFVWSSGLNYSNISNLTNICIDYANANGGGFSISFFYNNTSMAGIVQPYISIPGRVEKYYIQAQNRLVVIVNAYLASQNTYRSSITFYNTTTGAITKTLGQVGSLSWAEIPNDKGNNIRFNNYFLTGWTSPGGNAVNVGKTIGYTDFVTYTETEASIVRGLAFGASFNSATLKNYGNKYIEIEVNETISGSTTYERICMLKDVKSNVNLNSLISGFTKSSSDIAMNLSYFEDYDIVINTQNGIAVSPTIGRQNLSSHVDYIGNIDQYKSFYYVTSNNTQNTFLLYWDSLTLNVHYIAIKQPTKRFLSDYKLNTVHYKNIIDYSNNKLLAGNVGIINSFVASNTASGSITYTAAVQSINNSMPDFGFKKFASFSSGDSVELRIRTAPSFENEYLNIIKLFLSIATNPILYQLQDISLSSGGNDNLFNNTTTVNSGAIQLPVATNVPITTNPVYIQYTDLPAPINGDSKTDSITYFYNLPYQNTYQIGNFIKQELDIFILYGNYYGYDGENIYILTFQNQTGQNIGTFVSSSKIVSARGLKYIDASPTEAYFYSTFDNSIWSFNGGRSCEKVKGLSGLDSIVGGIYNVRDNTLFLETSTQLVWLRNGIWSLIDKTISQTNLQYYSTINGIYIKSGFTTWRYGYENIGSVLNLVYQTKFYGLPNNQTCKIVEWVLRIYDSTKSPHTIDLTNYVNDETGQSVQTVVVQINPTDYSTTGYTYLRLQPQYSRCISSSFKIECPDKIYLIDMTVGYNPDAPAVIQSSRSV